MTRRIADWSAAALTDRAGAGRERQAR
jgi:hypothetical protein